jgi:hypothetical protein
MPKAKIFKKHLLKRTSSQKLYEDACKFLGIKPITIRSFARIPDKEGMYAMHRITTVLRAVQGDQEFDWNNFSQEKRYPWWDMETYGEASAGSGFAFCVCGYGGTYAGVGSRLSTFSAEDTKAVALIMLEDYKTWTKGKYQLPGKS